MGVLRNSDFLGQGWAFPLGVDSGKVQWSADVDDIRQSILIVLQTMPGERVMVPTFGCRLGELLFEAHSVGTSGMAELYTQQALAAWEPRIDVTAVTATADSNEPNCLLISIDYVVRETNRPENLVYPFYLK